MAKQFNTTTILTNQGERDRLVKHLAPFAARYSAACDRDDETGKSVIVDNLLRMPLCRSLDGKAIMLGAMISLVGAYGPAGAAAMAA